MPDKGIFFHQMKLFPALIINATMYPSTQTKSKITVTVCHSNFSIKASPMKKKAKTAGLQREFHNILADIDSLLKESANLTGDEFSEVREKLQDRVAAAKESILEISSDLADRGRETASKANRAVHEEPWKAVGAGAVVGLLLGILFARR